MTLFIACLWGGEDTGGGPTTPPPFVDEATEPMWLVSPVLKINKMISVREDD